uniref:Transposase n=1 Tax=Steinernema glaseri TaxID=37863 RepID=A0A1I7Y2H6_9BILA
MAAMKRSRGRSDSRPKSYTIGSLRVVFDPLSLSPGKPQCGELDTNFRGGAAPTMASLHLQDVQQGRAMMKHVFECSKLTSRKEAEKVANAAHVTRAAITMLFRLDYMFLWRTAGKEEKYRKLAFPPIPSHLGVQPSFAYMISAVLRHSDIVNTDEQCCSASAVMTGLHDDYMINDYITH